jgi:hypothetical protein
LNPPWRWLAGANGNSKSAKGLKDAGCKAHLITL